MSRHFWIALVAASLVGIAGAGHALAEEPFSDGGNTCATAQGFYAYGQDGWINYGGDIDYYALRLSGCGTLNLGSTGSTDTYGYLLDANCRVIAQNDDANGSRNFNISARVSGGTYFLAVRHYSRSGTGAYRLGASFNPGITDQCGVCR